MNIGEMAEWSNAAVLKTVDLNGSGGSNPSLSAKVIEEKQESLLSALFLYCFDTVPPQAGRDVGAAFGCDEILERKVIELLNIMFL